MADYQAVETAVTDYQTVNGALPASMAALRSMFKDPVTSARFAIIIDTRHPGQVDVAAGEHTAEPGDGNCAYAG
jgi:hypothetical protein